MALATDFASWRRAARELLRRGVSPEDVTWNDGVQGALFDAEQGASLGDLREPHEADARVPARFVELAAIAADHADPARFSVLYRVLWKLTHGAPRTLDDPLDGDASRLSALVRDVRQDEHRMHAFVRFRPATAADGREHWIAWYRPQHRILARVAPFFARRYPSALWSLFTPESAAHWDGVELRFGPGIPRSSAPPPDELDALFLSYYASIFNPARANARLLHRHIPAQVRDQIPEGAMMPVLLREASSRVTEMIAQPISASSALVPAEGDLASLAAAASRCRACPIGERATQVVFGEGPRDAPLMIVGEQPGDEEDQQGRPFVGPAGQLLDRLMTEVGLERGQAFVTNAVKHFKWEPRGKRRLHAKPNRDEIGACRGWLLAEVEAIKPRMILCLGATAAQSFCGPQFRVARDRGRPTSTPWAPWWMATYHPSALLRAVSDEARRAIEADLRADFTRARDELLSITLLGRGRGQDAGDR